MTLNLSESDAEFWHLLSKSTAPSDSDLRRRLANEWQTSAQAEHASIASFSRFSLDLLAVAAPAELLEGAHRAALDEIRHARISFALASHYAGVNLGPGELPLPTHLPEVTLLSAAVAATREGCVSETLAAIEALEASQAASAPEARAALAVIAPDEMRHAELAWKFVRWAIGAGGARVADAVRSAFESSLVQERAIDPRISRLDDTLLHYGRLCGARRNATRERALREVVEPAITQLFAAI